MIFHSSPINFCQFLTSSDESQGNEVSSEDLVFRFESLLHLDQKLSFPCILSLDWTRHISLDRQTFSGTREPRYCDRCSFPNWANHIDQTHQRICTHSSCCRSMWPVPGCTLKASRSYINDFKCSVNAFGQHHRLTAVEQDFHSRITNRLDNVTVEVFFSDEHPAGHFVKPRSTKVSLKQLTRNISFESMNTRDSSSRDTLFFGLTIEFVNMNVDLSLNIDRSHTSMEIGNISEELAQSVPLLPWKRIISRLTTPRRCVECNWTTIRSIQSVSKRNSIVTSDEERQIADQMDMAFDLNISPEDLVLSRTFFSLRFDWSKQNVSQHEIMIWEHLAMESGLSSSSSSFFLRLEIGEFRTPFVCQLFDLNFKLTADLFAHLSSNAYRVQFLFHRWNKRRFVLWTRKRWRNRRFHHDTDWLTMHREWGSMHTITPSRIVKAALPFEEITSKFPTAYQHRHLTN